MRRLAGLLCLALLSACATAGSETAEKKLRILLVTQSLGYKHATAKRQGGEPSLVERTMIDLGKSTGLFTVDATQNVAEDFTRERLDRADLVMFYTTGMLPIREDVLKYFLDDWLRQEGRGFLGLHCASDTFKTHAPYWRMLGGTFDGHGKYGHAGPPFTVTVHEPDHSICKPWGSEFEIDDEVYLFRNWQPEKVRVLMSVNMAKTTPKLPKHIPIAWCREYGKGRVLYFVLGHEPRTWKDERYRTSLVNAVKWISGREPGPAAPNPDLSAAEDRKARSAVTAPKKR